MKVKRQDVIDFALAAVAAELGLDEPEHMQAVADCEVRASTASDVVSIVFRPGGPDPEPFTVTLTRQQAKALAAHLRSVTKRRSPHASKALAKRA